MKLASLVSAVLFGLIALLHAARLVLGTEVLVGGKVLPMWPSVVAALVAASLAWALWRERRAVPAEQLPEGLPESEEKPLGLGDEDEFRSALLGQLQTAADLRSSEDQVLWTIFGIFWAANAILLVALFTSGDLLAQTALPIIAAVGAGLSLVWHWIQSRALGHVERHEQLMQRIEGKLGFPEAFSIARIPDADYRRLLGVGRPIYRRAPRVRNVMPWCSLTATVVWGIVLLVAII